MTLKIIKLEKNNIDVIWPLFYEIISKTNTFIYEKNISKKEAQDMLFQKNSDIYVAYNQKNEVVGWYRLRPNQLGKGSHVANASFMVSLKYQYQGIGKQLGEHALNEARKKNYKAMQFNMVVCNNQASIKLWLKLGFRILARLPKAYQHSHQGYIDCFLLHKEL